MLQEAAPALCTGMVTREGVLSYHVHLLDGFPAGRHLGDGFAETYYRYLGRVARLGETETEIRQR